MPSAGPPQGYRRRLVQRRIDAESLPNLRVAIAEGRLRFHSAQVLKGPNSPPASFTVEEVLRGDPEALRQERGLLRHRRQLLGAGARPGRLSRLSGLGRRGDSLWQSYLHASMLLGSALRVQGADHRAGAPLRRRAPGRPPWRARTEC